MIPKGCKSLAEVDFLICGGLGRTRSRVETRFYIPKKPI